MNNQWWLRTQDEVFGPVTRDNLLEWARMGRIQPGQDVSCDGENWIAATDVAFLDMRWSIDIGDGQPRGPFNKQAAQALLASGRLPEGSKLVEVVLPPVETSADEDDDNQATSSQHCAVDESGVSYDDSADDFAAVSSGGVVHDDCAAASMPQDMACDNKIIDELKRQLETVQAGLRAAEARAADAENRVKESAAQIAKMRKQLSAAEAHAAEAESRAAEAEACAADAEARMQKAGQEAQLALTAAKSDLAEMASAVQASEKAYEGRIKSLSDEIKRLPPTAQLAADAQAAVYVLMREEADELAATLEAENKEAELLRQYRRARTERLLARRQELLRHIGTDADDMVRRALKANPEDPRTAHMRQELDALRVLQERSARESERKILDLSIRLRDSQADVKRLREQAADVTVVYRQLQEAREKLMTREKELMEERQRSESERQQHAATQQALLARVSSLEVGLPGTTNQSREARTVRLAPWMGLKQ